MFENGPREAQTQYFQYARREARIFFKGPAKKVKQTRQNLRVTLKFQGGKAPYLPSDTSLQGVEATLKSDCFL